MTSRPSPDLHALAGHLALGPFNLVSHDVGMMVGYAYAATYPAQVRRLVLPLFEAPNGLAEAQAYDPAGPGEAALHEYARRLAAPGALHAGLEYFRARTIDAEHNREQAKTKLTMPVLTIGGTASFGAALAGQICPLAGDLRA